MPAGKIVFAILILTGGLAAWWLNRVEKTAIYEPPIEKIEPSSPCPWRNAETELTHWFPGATSYEIVDFILSGHRNRIEEELGHRMRPEDMALHAYVVKSNDQQIGTVLTRRIKAEHGAVEVAMGISGDQRISKVKIQSIREPETTLAQLRTINIEKQFEGRSVFEQFSVTTTNEATAGQALAKQIAAEIRALLILFRTAESAPSAHH